MESNLIGDELKNIMSFCEERGYKLHAIEMKYSRNMKNAAYVQISATVPITEPAKATDFKMVKSDLCEKPEAEQPQIINFDCVSYNKNRGI